MKIKIKINWKSEMVRKIKTGLALGIPALFLVGILKVWGVLILDAIFFIGGCTEYLANMAPKMKKPEFKGRYYHLKGVILIGADVLFIALMVFFMGWQWIIFLMFNNYLTDISAYFYGSFLKKKYNLRPIWRAANANKSWVSSGLGVATSTLICTFVIYQFIPHNFIDSYYKAFFMALFGSAGAIAGDLVESRLKRRIGIKDSGKAFGTHGGFIDRTDSIFGATTAYLAYFIILLVIRGIQSYL